MALCSMTAFARSEFAHKGWGGSFEIKSVNARGLNVRTRLPAFLDGFDVTLRKRVAGRLDRGTVLVTLELRAGDQDSGIRVNEERLARLVALAGALRDRPEIEPARLDGLMRLPGVIESGPPQLPAEERSALEAALVAPFDAALDALIAARRREGEALATVLERALDTIGDLSLKAESCAAARLPAIRDRLATRLEELLDKSRIDERRLEEEVAVLALKLDVREELDRLKAHLAEVRNLLDKGSPVGRRLDFLAQEFNREANTLCAKSADSRLTTIGLDLKAAIDQFREQVQNIE